MGDQIVIVVCFHNSYVEKRFRESSPQEPFCISLPDMMLTRLLCIYIYYICVCVRACFDLFVCFYLLIEFIYLLSTLHTDIILQAFLAFYVSLCPCNFFNALASVLCPCKLSSMFLIFLQCP